ncbi:MAG: PIG-L family deacetylase [Acidimicrobiia bacterium]|nr:PIG-L family deacetylase [Acidimicrobiia bacterium]
MDRRKFINCLVSATAGSTAAIPTLGAQTEAASRSRGLRVVCVGAHPDDPESGCGGTLRLYAEQGCKVTVVYLTRGEAGIRGRSATEAATTRSAECEAACQVLGVEHTFAGQIDGATEITPERASDFAKLLIKLTPDVVLAHWPLDAHADHAIAGNLALRACLSQLPETSLYFFEVYTGRQTLNFHPTDYVDIHSSREIKKRATFAHASQNPAEWYPHHEKMEQFRGAEAGVSFAEGFVRLAHLGKGVVSRLLPPVRNCG